MVLGVAITVAAQKPRPAAKPAPKAKPIIFAVINDGKKLEPIALVEKGKLTPPVGGDGDSKLITSFHKTYYKPKTSYRLIFGGANDGTASITASDPASECAKNIADIAAVPTKAKLKGRVMALATNVSVAKAGSGVRRLPTAAERSEIEALVRAGFAKQKSDGKLDYHNLTALDVDGDAKAELVGSFWVETAPTTRALLFFIAEKGSDGKYSFVYSDFYNIKQEDVMSGEISSVDQGVLHELLLDIFDYDGDGTSEIFTYTQSFEGAGFNVYKREGGKWIRAFEGTNYHCAF